MVWSRLVTLNWCRWTLFQEDGVGTISGIGLHLVRPHGGFIPSRVSILISLSVFQCISIYFSLVSRKYVYCFQGPFLVAESIWWIGRLRFFKVGLYFIENGMFTLPVFPTLTIRTHPAQNSKYSDLFHSSARNEGEHFFCMKDTAKHNPSGEKWCSFVSWL